MEKNDDQSRLKKKQLEEYVKELESAYDQTIDRENFVSSVAYIFALRKLFPTNCHSSNKSLYFQGEFEDGKTFQFVSHDHPLCLEKSIRVTLCNKQKMFFHNVTVEAKEGVNILFHKKRSEKHINIIAPIDNNNAGTMAAEIVLDINEILKSIGKND
jgi:predicted ATPase